MGRARKEYWWLGIIVLWLTALGRSGGTGTGRFASGRFTVAPLIQSNLSWIESSQ